MNRRFVTINEAAQICGVARRTIYHWITEGFLNPIRRTPSGSIRIDKTLLLKESTTRYKHRNTRKEKLNGQSEVRRPT